MSGEFEIIHHKNLPGLEMFFVNVLYRTPHAHSDMECCLLLRGKCEVSAGGRTISLSAGDFALLRPLLVHELRSSGDGALFLAAQLRPAVCRDYAGDGALEFDFAAGSERLGEAALRDFRRGMLALANCCLERGPGWEFEATGVLNLLLAVLARSFPRFAPGQGRRAAMDERARRILGYIEANCTRKLLLGEIAAAEGLTVSYLSHFFRENFNTTFQEYLAGLRCERARQFLADRSLSLLDVSISSGFSDVKYLNRAFTARYGCSPAEYRRGAAESGPARHDHPAAQRFYTEIESRELLRELQK